MSNPFDQFDEPKRNPFDEFDTDYSEMSVRDAVDSLPKFLTRTAEEKNTAKASANNRAFIGSLDNLDRVTGPGAFAGQYVNSSTFGLGDEINAGIDTALGINTMGDSYSQRKGKYRDMRGRMIEENPLTALAGDLGGYLAPGAAAWKSMAAAGKSIPGAAALTNAAQNAGRVPAYLQRLMGSSALFTADAALHGSTVGASNEAALTGNNPTIADRAETGARYASTNLGDMADGFGVNVPSFLKPIPVAPIMPAVGSVIERTAKGLGSGGRMITPDRVQAEVMNNVGRAPSPNSTATAMAEVIPGERVTSGTVKTFRFVENALRNGLKDAGLSPTDISSRVTRGFNTIKQSLPASWHSDGDQEECSCIHFEHGARTGCPSKLSPSEPRLPNQFEYLHTRPSILPHPSCDRKRRQIYVNQNPEQHHEYCKGQL